MWFMFRFYIQFLCHVNSVYIKIKLANINKAIWKRKKEQILRLKPIT